MADCTCNPKYLIYAAENSLSPDLAAKAAASLYAIAPNPFPEGRARMERNWEALWNKHASRLIWC
jgi:hypothetical protein